MAMRLVEIAPFWTIARARAASARSGDGVQILLEDGPGFGDGRHETTELCLQAVSAFVPRTRGGFRVLDFGSGSGILAIGAAKLGAVVDAVEIDEAAVATAERNARLNAVADKIRFWQKLPQPPLAYDLVLANILRSVLLEFAGELTTCVATGGALVLSGLVSTDVPEVAARYASLLGGRRPDVTAKGEWRALAWSG